MNYYFLFLKKVIPRTLRPEGNKQMSPEELFHQIFPKLEKLRRQQETNELFERKLQESDISSIDTRVAAPAPPPPIKSKNLAEAIREKFQLDDDNDQAILDQHVSRVWSDLTPSRSPGTMSPFQSNTSRRRTTHDLGFSDMRYTEGSSSTGNTHYTYCVSERLMFFFFVKERLIFCINFRFSFINETFKINART